MEKLVILVFLSLSLLMKGDVVNGIEERKPEAIWPDFDKAYAAVFNEREDQFDPLIDDGRRVAHVGAKDLKVLNGEQLKQLQALVTGKHPATAEIDFYRPTAGVWFERDGTVVGFLEFSFDSFSRRSDLEKTSKEVDWRGLAKWYEALGLKTNFNGKRLAKMWLKKQKRSGPSEK